MGAATPPLTAPFPYFGGKRRVASMVWERFGPTVANYVEPCFGSGAVLLARPGFDPADPPTETVNDADCFVANFWRAVKADPRGVAELCDWPVNEADLEARHKWLVTASRKADLERRCKDDPEHYDVRMAAWWCWGLSCWIGSGWCAGEWHGPGDVRNAGAGINTIGSSEQRAASSEQRGARGKRPELYSRHGINVLPSAASRTSQASKAYGNADPRAAGMPGSAPTHTHTHTHTHTNQAEKCPTSLATGASTPGGREDGEAADAGGGLLAWFEALSTRLRRVRVVCGDWRRVTGPSVTVHHGTTAVFLDPPYADTAGRADAIYRCDDLAMAHAVRAWAIEQGSEPLMRIALCGYEGEHEMPPAWECVAWSAHGGYGSQGDGPGKQNRHRERIWFSPHCVRPSEFLFDT